MAQTVLCMLAATQGKLQVETVELEIAMQACNFSRQQPLIDASSWPGLSRAPGHEACSTESGVQHACAGSPDRVLCRQQRPSPCLHSLLWCCLEPTRSCCYSVKAYHGYAHVNKHHSASARAPVIDAPGKWQVCMLSVSWQCSAWRSGQGCWYAADLCACAECAAF